MKKAFLIWVLLAVVAALALTGCSEVPSYEIEQFCQDKGFTGYAELNGGFECFITDYEYSRLKLWESCGNCSGAC